MTVAAGVRGLGVGKGYHADDIAYAVDSLIDLGATSGTQGVFYEECRKTVRRFRNRMRPPCWEFLLPFVDIVVIFH